MRRRCRRNSWAPPPSARRWRTSLQGRRRAGDQGAGTLQARNLRQPRPQDDIPSPGRGAIRQVRPLIDTHRAGATSGRQRRPSAALASRAGWRYAAATLGARQTHVRPCCAQFSAPPVDRALNGGILLKAYHRGRLESADELAGILDSEAEGKSITAAALRLARVGFASSRVERQGPVRVRRGWRAPHHASIESPAISRGARR